jgi:hypothetical protein
MAARPERFWRVTRRHRASLNGQPGDYGRCLPRLRYRPLALGRNHVMLGHRSDIEADRYPDYR